MKQSGVAMSAFSGIGTSYPMEDDDTSMRWPVVQAGEHGTPKK
jgi:hypothetical protein